MGVGSAEKRRMGRATFVRKERSYDVQTGGLQSLMLSLSRCHSVENMFHQESSSTAVDDIKVNKKQSL